MKRFDSLLTSAVIVLVALASHAQATIINIVNVDFNGFRGVEGVGATYVGAGAAGGGNIFNGLTADSSGGNDNLTVGGTNLLNDAGATTSVALTISPVGGDNQTSGSPASNPVALFYDYVFNNSAGNGPGQNSPFTISNLAPGGQYEVYLYAGFANVSLIANTSVTGGTLTAFSPTGIFNSTNTELYLVHADGSGNIYGAMGNSATNVLGGLTVAEVVPEPSSLVLFGLGAIGMLLVARRRRRA